MKFLLRSDVTLVLVTLFLTTSFIGCIDCIPLPSNVETSKDENAYQSNELNTLQQLRTSIERMRLQAQNFESSLKTMKSYEIVKLTNAQLQHGSQNDLIALQHALLTFAHSICPSVENACLRYEGFPTYAHQQAYKSITLLHLLRSLPLAEADEFVEGFLESATISDISALKRVLEFSKNPRIHKIFGNDLQGNSGIIGRHMKRDNGEVHLHLHGSYPPEPRNNVKLASFSTDEHLVKRKFTAPLPQCTFKKRSMDDYVTMEKRKYTNSPPECNGNMVKKKDHYEYKNTMNKPVDLHLSVKKD